MPSSLAARFRDRWFAFVVAVSAALVLVTFLSYTFGGDGGLPSVLFLIGLGGENNFGAWWSGMLLLLGAVLAFDGYSLRGKPLAERHGWLSLSAVLLLLSFDEVASLHEYLGGKGLTYLAPLALLVAMLASYALVQLYRGGVPRRVTVTIVASFALFTTIPLQEFVQHSLAWDNQSVYGLRALIEEGTELIAMLLLVSVTRANGAALLASSADVLTAVARLRTQLIVVAAALAPLLTAATFVLPYPGGPADWLAAAAFFGCALLVVRSTLLTHATFDRPMTLLLLFYLAASAAANAVRLEWDPVVLGRAIGFRGLCVAALLLAAVPILRGSGRAASPMWFFLAALAAAAAAVLWPHSQLLWCLVPPLVALSFYAIESKAATVSDPSALQASRKDASSRLKIAAG